MSIERQQTLNERQAIKERIKTVTEVGLPILAESNLVKPKAEITHDDLTTIKKFYEAVAPTPENCPLR